jgi:hypothetical protein
MRNKPDSRPHVGEAFDLELTKVIYDPTRKTKPAIERSTVGRGEYFAIDGQVTAFVMLDEDAAPQCDAANDPK